MARIIRRGARIPKIYCLGYDTGLYSQPSQASAVVNQSQFPTTARRGAYANSADIGSRSERRKEVPLTLSRKIGPGFAIVMTNGGANASLLSKSSSKNLAGLRLRSRPSLDYELISRKLNCGVVSNRQAAMEFRKKSLGNSL